MDRYRFNRSLFPDESPPPTPSTNEETSGEAEATSSSGKENLDPAGDYLGASSKSYLIKILRKQGEGNYDVWKIKMKTLLRSQNLWSYVEDGFMDPENEEYLSAAHRKTLEEDRMMDAKALVFLQQSVPDEIFHKIIRANKAKEAWDTLERELEVDSDEEESELQSLRREFESLEMRESENLRDYAARVVKLAMELKALGEDINDEMIIKQILCSLPSGTIMKLLGGILKKHEHVFAIANEAKVPSSDPVEPYMALAKFNGSKKVPESRKVEVGIQTEEDGLYHQKVAVRNEINHIIKRKVGQIFIEGDQQVLFADKVLKYTGKGKVKRRFLIISEFAVYIIDPETNALKRRVSLAAVEKIFMSQLHDHFIAIHVPTEYDILLASTRKTEIAIKLVDATRSSPDYELQVIRSNRFEYNASAELVKEVHNEPCDNKVRVGGSNMTDLILDMINQ
ncbi:Myosin ID heavy chain-like protein [Drosera capensis]